MSHAETIFHGPPTQPDFRQSFLKRALSSDAFKEAIDGYQTASIETRGWPASAVNLGWLQDRIKEFWRVNPGMDPQEYAKQIRAQLPGVISRLKFIKVEPGTVASHASEPRRVRRAVHMDVKIKTKDDHGWYVYEFSAFLEPHEDSP